MPRLSALPGVIRLAAGCFAALVLGFVLLAQVNLWYQVDGGNPPGPDKVLVRYHGDPDRTRLDVVLDLELSVDDPRNMWQYLGGSERDDPVTTENHAKITDWIRAGAPEAGWSKVAPIFTGMGKCGDCHVEGGVKADMPFETYAQVLPHTKPGGKYPMGSLLISAHNHLFGFAVLAFLLSLGVGLTGLPTRLKMLLILGASGGAALDIAGWFLTRAWGSPFQMMIMLGGGLFGLCTTLMAVALLYEAAFGRGGKGDAA